MELTRWSPDTCNCLLVFAWDKEIPSEQRTHKIHLIERACPDHEHLSLKGNDHHYKTVLDENQRKNIAHGKIGTDKAIRWEFKGMAPHRVLHVFDLDSGTKIAEVEATVTED